MYLFNMLSPSLCTEDGRGEKEGKTHCWSVAKKNIHFFIFMQYFFGFCVIYIYKHFRLYI